MEDVLQTGHQEISLTGDQDEPESVKGSRGPSRAASRVDVHTSASNLARISRFYIIQILYSFGNHYLLVVTYIKTRKKEDNEKFILN